MMYNLDLLKILVGVVKEGIDKDNKEITDLQGKTVWTTGTIQHKIYVQYRSIKYCLFVEIQKSRIRGIKIILICLE